MVQELVKARSAGFTDPGWEHCVAQDEKRKKVKCNYCGKVVSGGVYRLKQHLARISGEVAFCRKVPYEVFKKMSACMEGCRANKRRRLEDVPLPFDLHTNDEDGGGKEPVGYKRRKRTTKTNQSSVTSIIPLRSLGYIDPGWEHGIAADEKKKKIKCNYCEKIVSGGINRFKQHLARIPGEVAFCKMAPEEVYLKMKENMKWHRSGRRGTPEAKEHSALFTHSDNSDVNEQANGQDKVNHLIDNHDISSSKPMKRRSSRRSSLNATSAKQLQFEQINLDLVLSKTPQNHTSISKHKSGSEKNYKEVVSAICKFFCYAAIPFDVADSPYFQKMLDLIGQHQPGSESLGSRLISGQLLQEVETMKGYLEDGKAFWATTGCSILADSWKNVEGRTIINFMVSCARGTYFISSTDASDAVQDAASLFRLLDKVVGEVGEANVVQVITENTACFRAAGKLLEEKRKCLYWTPCAAHCFDQILVDFAKLESVRQCIEKGQKITRFIYNQLSLLNLMREFTSGKDLLKPAMTKSLTTFHTLQSLLDHRSALRKMFQSSKWASSDLAKSDEGKEVEKLILKSTFWKKTQYIKKSVEPVLQVLRKVESKESLSMPSIYSDIYHLRHAIKVAHSDDEQKCGPFWSVVDNHLSSVVHHPLSVAAYFLNPSHRYRPDFMALPEVIRGLNECITRLEPDSIKRVSAAAQIPDFVYAKADFGTELALSTRMDLDPAVWWQQHGINCLELQRLAVRILSQPCASLACEHNWSRFDYIHSERHSRFVLKGLNDFSSVHYNLRLREKQLKKTVDDSICLENPFLESLLDNWVMEIGNPASKEEAIYTNLQRADLDVNEVNRNGSLDDEGLRRTRTNLASVPEIVEPLEDHAPIRGSAVDEDINPNFVDDELSD